MERLVMFILGTRIRQARYFAALLIAVGAFVTWCVTPIWQFSSGIESTHRVIAIVVGAVWSGVVAWMLRRYWLAVGILGVSSVVLFLGAMGAFDFWLGLAAMAAAYATVAIIARHETEASRRRDRVLP